MFRRLGDSMRRFMYGRYGSDRLNMVLVFGGLLLSIVSSFSDSLAILSVLTYVPLFWAIFRMFSKNIAARQREAAAFNRFTKYFTDRQNRYFACPSCSQTVRVPRRKGRISIKCPRCGQRFEKKT
ncbi:MAG: zinc-ribbon domain-containing protein [Oscillospiraceae bacterium]|nr:zinc-ribbon domain-containing protein [Oscillospiraceae bacterium]